MTTTLSPPDRPNANQSNTGNRSGAPGRGPGGSRPNFAARRMIALLVVLALVVSVFWLAGRVVGWISGGPDTPTKAAATPSHSVTAAARPHALAPEVPAPKPTAHPAQGAAGPSGKTSMVRTMRLFFNTMAPKSIVAGPSGMLFAQNMMYHHSITVFTPDGALLKTIPDSVQLSDYGITGHAGTSKGAPVEMAFTPDGKEAWVSNYSMYGKGFGPEGLDSCTAGDGTDTSYVYRINTSTFAIDQVVPVGSVPKYVAVTPDGKHVLVTNWCSWNLSIIDTATNKETARVDLHGRYPRGIVVSPDSTTAYVALMGSNRVVTVDLATKAVRTLAEPGIGPRHIVISPDAKYLYVSNNRSGDVVKLDRATGKIIGRAQTGSEPRSVAISSDGEAIYVVNYGAGSMSKVRTSDMKLLQTVPTDASPIGITYEPKTKSVWVACYGGSLIVFDDSKLAA